MIVTTKNAELRQHVLNCSTYFFVYFSCFYLAIVVMLLPVVEAIIEYFVFRAHMKYQGVADVASD